MRPGIWRSPPARITASARRWPAWRPRSRSNPSRAAFSARSWISPASTTSPISIFGALTGLLSTSSGSAGLPGAVAPLDLAQEPAQQGRGPLQMLGNGAPGGARVACQDGLHDGAMLARGVIDVALQD